MQLNKLLQEDFATNSYIDFLNTCQRKMNGFIATMVNITNSIDPEQDTSTITYPTTQEILQSLGEYNLSDSSIISTSKGFCTISEFIEQYENALSAYYAGSIDSLDEVNFQLTNNLETDDVIQPLSEIMDDIKGNLACSIAESTCLLASIKESVSDRVSYFATKIATMLDSQDSAVNNIINYYKQLLIDDVSQSDLLSTFFRTSGASELDADTDPCALMDFDIYQFTGANPMGAISFGCLADGIKSVGKIIGSACTGIFNAVKTGVKWLWNKARKYTVEVFSDPYDVTDTNNKRATYSFDGFQYQDTRTGLSRQINGQYMVRPTGVSLADCESIGDDLLNHWFVIRTVGGEIAIRPSYILVEESNYADRAVTVQWKGQILFKPYSLSTNIDKGADIDEFVANFESQTEGSYFDVNQSELDLYNSFTYGCAVTANILASYANLHNIGSTYTWNPHFTPRQTAVTNLDWFKMATGYYKNFNLVSFHTFPEVFGIAQNWAIDLSQMGTLFMYILLGVKMNKLSQGYSGDTYVPYTCDTCGMSQGRFGIKTDSQNQDVATAFTAAIVAIVIIVIVVVTGAIVVRKLTRKAFWKRTEFVGRMDNRMWNGGTLSAAEKRKYIRYSRKLNACQLLEKGISTASTVGEKVSSLKDEIPTVVQSMISGSNPDMMVGSGITLYQLKHLIDGD